MNSQMIDLLKPKLVLFPYLHPKIDAQSLLVCAIHPHPLFSEPEHNEHEWTTVDCGIWNVAKQWGSGAEKRGRAKSGKEARACVLALFLSLLEWVWLCNWAASGLNSACSHYFPAGCGRPESSSCRCCYTVLHHDIYCIALFAHTHLHTHTVNTTHSMSRTA